MRSRSVNTFGDSVGSFRRDLKVLQRTTPTTVRPANRLRDGHGRNPGGAGLRAASAIRGTRIDAVSDGPGRPRRSDDRPGAGGHLTRPMAGNAAALRRRQAQKRRRDVFFALLAGAAGSLLLALIPGMSIMWSAQILFDVLLGGYVAVLVRLRNLAAERELKLRFIPAHRAARRQAYDLGPAGYGDIELRRAAN